MRAFELEDEKEMLSIVVSSASFGHWLLHSARLCTDSEFDISGGSWETVRAVCERILSGTGELRSLSIVLKLSQKDSESFLKKCCSEVPAEADYAFFMTFTLENGSARCITGMHSSDLKSMVTVGREWDGLIGRYLRVHGITVKNQ